MFDSQPSVLSLSPKFSRLSTPSHFSHQAAGNSLKLLAWLLQMPDLKSIWKDLERAQTELSSGKAATLSSALGHTRHQLLALLPQGVGQNILNLACESSRGLFGQGLLELASCFEGQQNLQAASQLLSIASRVLKDVSGFESTYHQALHRLEVINGGGNLADQVQMFAHSLPHELQNGGMLVGMMAAGIVNPIATRVVGRWFRASVRKGVKLALANIGGMVADGFVFEAASRGVRMVQGQEVGCFSEGLGGAYWMIVNLRLMGLAGKLVSQSTKFNRVVTSLARNQVQRVHKGLYTAFEYGGIYFSQTRGDWVGIEQSPMPYAWMQSAFTLCHFKTAGVHLRALAPGFGSLTHRLQMETAKALRESATRAGEKFQRFLQAGGKLPPGFGRPLLAAQSSDGGRNIDSFTGNHEINSRDLSLALVKAEASAKGGAPKPFRQMLEVLPQLFEENSGQRLAVLSRAKALIPQLEKGQYGDLFKRFNVLSRLETSNGPSLLATLEILELRYLSGGVSARVSDVIARRLMDSSEKVRQRMAQIFANSMEHIPQKARLRATIELIPVALYDPSQLVREPAIQALVSGFSLLSLSSRRQFIPEVAKYHFNALPEQLVQLILDRVPAEELQKTAEALENDRLRHLARYSESRLPWMGEFARCYLEMPEPDFFAWAQAEVAPYRRGKVLTFPDDSVAAELELRLAYAGLDRPEGLAFEQFTEQIQRRPISEPFITGTYRFRVPILTPAYDLIDKSHLHQAIKVIPPEDTSTTELYYSFLQWFDSLEKDVRSGLCQKCSIELNKHGLAKVPDPWPDEFLPWFSDLVPVLRKEGLFSQFLESSRTSMASDDLAMLLAWHQFAPAGIKRTIETTLGKLSLELEEEESISSALLEKGLRATEEFYRDSIGESMKRLGFAEEDVPEIEKRHSKLRETLEAIRKIRQAEEGQEVEVEVVFSKTQTDQFYSQVADDCNARRGKGALIYNPNFMTPRMLSEGKLSGMLYVQETVLDDHRVLIAAIQPRTFWNVDHGLLLDRLKETLIEVAREEQNDYDYVLLVNEDYQQSNRYDMQTEIAERKYRPIGFKDNIDEALGESIFSEPEDPMAGAEFLRERTGLGGSLEPTKTFLVMYKKPGLP